MNVVGVAGGIVLFQRQLQPQVGATDLLKSTQKLFSALADGVLDDHFVTIAAVIVITQLKYCG